MTDDMMNLRTILEKTPDADILRDMISFAAGRLMELEVGTLTGAAHGEKSAREAWSGNSRNFERFSTRGCIHDDEPDGVICKPTIYWKRSAMA